MCKVPMPPRSSQLARYRVQHTDQAEMISLDAEVLSFPEDKSAIAALFGIENPDSRAPAGVTLPPNL